MKCNISRFRFLFFSLLFSFSFILIAPTDTYATRVDVDVNNLTDYFSDGFRVSVQQNHFTFTDVNTQGFLLVPKSDLWSNIGCSQVYVGVKFNSPLSTVISDNFSSGNVNFDGINNVSYSDSYYIAWRNSSSSYIPFFALKAPYRPASNAGYSNGSTFIVDSLVYGCSEEEVAPLTPTPTPTEEPTPTPTAEPTPTPTVTPGETVNPNDYEYNQMEDTAVRYSFYAFCIICLSAFLIYETIIKRIILK